MHAFWLEPSFCNNFGASDVASIRGAGLVIGFGLGAEYGAKLFGLIGGTVGAWPAVTSDSESVAFLMPSF